MDDHRQAAVARNTQLFAKKPFLADDVAGLEAVDADFADRYEMRIGDRLTRGIAQAFHV